MEIGERPSAKAILKDTERVSTVNIVLETAGETNGPSVMPRADILKQWVV